MKLSRILIEYIDGLGQARVAFQWPGVLVPFAAFAAVQCAILIALAYFTASPLAPVMVPLLRLLGGEESLHYPMHFVRMPETYARAYLPLAATVGFALWGYAVWLMCDRRGVRAGAHRQYRRAMGAMILVGVAFVIASEGIGRATSLLASRIEGTMGARAFWGMGLVLTVCVQSFLVYAPFFLRARGGGPLSAIARSVEYTRRRFAVTFLVVASIAVVHLPFDFLLANAHRVAFRFRPELVFHLLLASVLLEMVTAYVLFSVTTGLALSRQEATL